MTEDNISSSLIRSKTEHHTPYKCSH